MSETKFRRFARLLVNLPAESRFVRKVSPFKDWTWDKEMQSQILRSIDTFATMFANSNRRKGKAPMKPPKQTQPDYVEKAKEDMIKRKTEENKEEQKSLAEIFEKRNSEIKQLEEITDGT